jgi:enterochelin esterase family protein
VNPHKSSKTPIQRVLAVLLLLASTACRFVSRQTTLDYASFEAFVQELETIAGSGERSQVNGFWQALVANDQVPFVYGDRVAFLYRGRARSVRWVGDFTDWQHGPPLEGQRAGKSDLWVAYATFPTNARLEYRIAVDEQTAIPDPANPVQQWSGFGPNSVVAMPEYVFPDEILPREDMTAGELSKPISIESAELGYTVNVQVYTPAGYAALADLPTIYVTDAHEYTDPRMGAMPIVLDNLIAASAAADARIEPLIAVFIDPRDPKTGVNRRQDEFLSNPAYAAFIARELVPFIDRTYKTEPSPDRRAILGESYGGVNAAYCALTYPDLFHLVAMQSPAFVDDSLYKAYESTDRLPFKVFLSAGYPWDFDARTIRDILEAKQYALLYQEVPEGHSWGQWRAQLDDLLTFLFPHLE